MVLTKEKPSSILLENKISKEEFWLAKIVLLTMKRIIGTQVYHLELIWE